ncbi:hypothetical protein H0H81_008534, partial [Sphagnurus paluster]
ATSAQRGGSRVWCTPAPPPVSSASSPRPNARWCRRSRRVSRRVRARVRRRRRMRSRRCRGRKREGSRRRPRTRRSSPRPAGVESSASQSASRPSRSRTRRLRPRLPRSWPGVRRRSSSHSTCEVSLLPMVVPTRPSASGQLVLCTPSSSGVSGPNSRIGTKRRCAATRERARSTSTPSAGFGFISGRGPCGPRAGSSSTPGSTTSITISEPGWPRATREVTATSPRTTR